MPELLRWFRLVRSHSEVTRGHGRSKTLQIQLAPEELEELE